MVQVLLPISNGRFGLQPLLKVVSGLISQVIPLTFGLEKTNLVLNLSITPTTIQPPTSILGKTKLNSMVWKSTLKTPLIKLVKKMSNSAN